MRGDRIMKKLVGYCIKFIMMFGVILLVISALTIRTSAYETLNMISNANCSYYSRQNSNAIYKVGSISFGQNIKALEYGEKWTTVEIAGEEYYVLSKNLVYEKKRVIKTAVKATQKAGNSKTSLGYVPYGSEIEVLRTDVVNGKEYVYCKIPVTYTASDFKTQNHTDVEGYILMSSLDKVKIPKVINIGTFMYGAPSSEAEKVAVYTGQEVEVIQANSTWSKILVNDKNYYIYSSRLDDKVIYVTSKSVTQRKLPSTSSNVLHYVYWNTPVTVLGTYVTSSGSTYCYCDISGDKGFILMENATKSYLGYNESGMAIEQASMYSEASSATKVLATVPTDGKFTVYYKGSNWTRINYQGIQGYIPTGKVYYKQGIASGSYFTTAYKLYKGNTSGTLSGQKISVLAENSDSGYVYVQTEAGKRYWMEADSVIYSIEREKMVAKENCGYYNTSNGTLKAGTLYFGTEVEVVGYTDKRAKIELNGGIYFVNLDNLEKPYDKRTPKVINSGTYIYAQPTTTSDKYAVYTGEEVKVICSNNTWSKVYYNNEIFYIYNTRLDDKKLTVKALEAEMLAAASKESEPVAKVYWNTQVTLLNTYDEGNNRIYYCSLDGINGYFVEELGTESIFGGTRQMVTNLTASAYKYASSEADAVFTLLADSTVLIDYMGSNWARVYDGDIVYYVPISRLYYQQKKVSGAYYETVENLYSKSSAGYFESETVEVIACDEKLGLAYVRNEDGECFYIDSLQTDLSSGERLYVLSRSATLHSAPTAESESVEIPYMTEVECIGRVTFGELGSWWKIIYQNQIYYVWQNYDGEKFTNSKSTTDYEANTDIQNELKELALDIAFNWPTKYAHEQSDGVLDIDGYYGFDCSGFVAYLYNTVMQNYVATYRLTKAIVELSQTVDIYNKGFIGEFAASPVELENIRLGDVLFFDLEDENEDPGSDGVIDHCGMYLGNNEFVHSTNSWGGGVCIMPIDGIYERGLISVLRFEPDNITPAGCTMYTNSYTPVYEKMDGESSIIDRLNPEEQITLCFTNNKSFAYIEYDDGKKGFVYISHLSEGMTDIAIKKNVAKFTQKLYVEPSTSSDAVLAVLGDEVLYRGQYGNTNFFKVDYAGGCYYVYCKDEIDDILTDKIEQIIYNRGAYLANTTTYLRTFPNSEEAGNIIRKIPLGEVVTLYAISDSGNWAYIEDTDGNIGFSSMKALEPYDATDIHDEARYVLNITQKLYLSPSTQAEYITVYAGDEVMFNGFLGSTKYAKVTYRNQQYYMYMSREIDQLLTADMLPYIKGALKVELVKGTNMRSTPGSIDSSNLIRFIKAGEIVSVVISTDTSSWLYVIDDSGNLGFISAKAIVAE